MSEMKGERKEERGGEKNRVSALRERESGRHSGVTKPLAF